MPAMLALGKELGISLENGVAGVANGILDMPQGATDDPILPQDKTANA